jgi:hypothetical protein
MMAEPDKKISLVLADVDGTLVTKEKLLTERAIKAVEALRARGIRFALTSGRPPRGMDMLIAPLGITEPIAGFNGGLFVKPDLSIIEARTLSRETAEQTVALLHKEGVDVWVYSGEDWLVPSADGPHVAREKWTVKFDRHRRFRQGARLGGQDRRRQRRSRADEEGREGCAGGARRSRLRGALAALLSRRDPSQGQQGRRGREPGRDARDSGRGDRDVGRPAERRADVPKEWPVDRDGTGQRWAPPRDEVKARATHVSASSEEEGFAKAIERYVLGLG